MAQPTTLENRLPRKAFMPGNTEVFYSKQVTSLVPLHRAASKAVPYVIAVCHQKGGVAKTTTVSSLGAALAGQNQRTLLVDLDPSGNLTHGMGFSPGLVSRSAADILLGNETLYSIRQATSVDGLDIVPSNDEMVTVARFLNLRPKYEHLLSSCLSQPVKSVGQAYDFVLIDCPPALGPLTITALTAARMALIPTQCEYYSLQALDGIFKTIASVRSNFNHDLHYRMLVTMFDRRGLLHTRVLGMLRERFRDVLFENMIGFDSKLRESQLVGLPVTAHAPRARAALQYRLLAGELYRDVSSQIIS
jgi:chromosome partitioning protein